MIVEGRKVAQQGTVAAIVHSMIRHDDVIWEMNIIYAAISYHRNDHN